MKGVILAAGQGTRLRPLTEHYPKPMLPVGGRPLLEHLLELLRSHGIRDVAINLHHRPEVVTERLADGSRLDMRIVYFHEERLLGTAGALKNMASFLDETFVVLCGDLLTDADLSSLAEFHRWRDAVATIALCRVEEPSRAGIVEVAGNGRVLHFEEKPPPDRSFTDLACAGIYVFEPSVLAEIADESPSDLGRDLFPRLLEKGLPVFGLEGVGQVLDIGSAERYAMAQVLAASLKPNGNNGHDEAAIIPFPTRHRDAPARGKHNGDGDSRGTRPLITDFLAESRRTLECLDPSDVEAAVSLLVAAHRRHAAVFAIGNGGSAATASHLAGDLTRGTQHTGGLPLRAFSLSDNVPQLTAWANDASYEDSFAGQLRAYARRGDVLVAVSASGNSPNILAAARQARDTGLTIIALTGFGGGQLKELADAALVVDSYDYGQVEGTHMVLVHLLSKAVISIAAQDSQRHAAAERAVVAEAMEAAG